MDDRGTRKNESIHIQRGTEMRKFIVLLCAVLLTLSVGIGVNASNENKNDEVVTVASERPKIKEETVEVKDKIVEKTTTPIIESTIEPMEVVEETTVEPIETEVVAKPLYTDEELYVLSYVINGEAEGCSWEEKLWVGSVVLNRVDNHRYPDTIYDVVFDKGQYACTWDGNYDKEPIQESIDAAIYLLENGSVLPKYVIFQAQFKQGNATYDVIGNTYFCYYKEDVE